MHNRMLSVLTQQNKFSLNHRVGEAGRDLRVIWFKAPA